ncbi:MAG: mechanosensitive ion channel family protein [Desulfovibrionaceae bacterium]
MNDMWQTASLWVGVYGLRLVVALVILAVGMYVARRLASVSGRLMLRAGVEETLSIFLRKILYYCIVAAVVVAALGQVGINVTSFLAVLGAAGLAVGLALKDSLSNFAAGVMLILNRFFRVGDFVTVAGVSGTVKAMSIFNTELTTGDNQRIFVPNSSILGSVIVNTSANPTRRVDMVFGIGYGDDIDAARAAILELIAQDSRILSDPAPTVAVSELADSSVNFVVRPWVNAADYWAVRFDFTEKVKKAFDAKGISIPFPQQDVHMHHVG